MAAQLKVKRGPSGNLSSLPVVDGQLLFTTDTKKIYLDHGTTRLQVGGGTVTTGSANGTIAVDGIDIAVKGLGARAFDSTSYLPLTGGTLTGSLSVNGSVQAGSIWSKQASAEASVGVQNGALNSQLYLYANSSACGLYFSNSGNGANGNVIKVTADGTKTFYGNITGTATRLATARTFTIGNGSSSFDGTTNVSLDVSKIFTTYTSNQSVSWDDLSTGFTEMIGNGDVLWNGTNNPSNMPGFYRWGGTLTLNANGCSCGAFAQLYFAHTSSSDAGILYRSGWYSDRQPWARILDSNNYTSYCAPAGHTHSYLPLSGGTLSGGLTLAYNNLQAYLIDNEPSSTTNHGYSHHGLSLGYSGHDYVDWYEYGGAWNFYKSVQGTLTKLCYINTNGIYGAVWNDYAEFRKTVSDAKPGQIVTENGDGTQRITTKRLQRGCNVVSDTFGFAIGETDECKTPVACAGRALVYTYENRYDFQPGEAVCSGPNGTVSHMTREEMISNPDCIVGFVSEIPEYKVWGTGNVEVDGRIWIKVR